MKSRNGIALLVAGLLGVGGCSGEKSGTPPLVSGLVLTQVAAYQGLKTTVMKDGAPATAEVPIIAGKALRLRAFVAPQDNWQSREINVRFTLTSAGETKTYDVKKTFVGASSEATFDTTAILDVPAEQVTGDLAFSVSLLEVKGRGDRNNLAAKYPADGEVSLEVKTTGVIPVVVIPVQYMADGSGRMPDTSTEAMERLRVKMQALYPVADVQLTVGEPLAFSRQITPDGGNWDRLLEAVLRKRYDDGVASNVYYYGLFVPEASFENFCYQGCVLGLSLGGDDEDTAWMRGSIGLGYVDKYAETDVTFVHEIGHAHGRNHAPCGGPDGVDRNFPYDNGGIGVWGYDATTNTLLNPEGKSRDMMGYCENAWVSDYTYNALYDRVSYVNSNVKSLRPTKKWRTVILNNEGAIKGDVIDAPTRGGKEVLVERLSDSRTDQVPARFFPFDHIPGGMLLIPEDEEFGDLAYRGVSIQ